MDEVNDEWLAQVESRAELLKRAKSKMDGLLVREGEAESTLGRYYLI